MNRLLIALIAALLVIAIGGFTSRLNAPKSLASNTITPAVTTTSRASDASAFPVGKYAPAVQQRIDATAIAQDCLALQNEFNTASANDAATRTRTGSGTADLMSYIDARMGTNGCYK